MFTNARRIKIQSVEITFIYRNEQKYQVLLGDKLLENCVGYFFLFFEKQMKNLGFGFH